MSRVIVVTGTDTRMGKTVFAAGLADALGAHYWKPVQAGLEGGVDSAMVASLASCPLLPEAYRLTNPCSPDRAAELDGKTIDPEELAPPEIGNRLIVEGAGGVLVPIMADLLFADLFARWGHPAVLVARTAIGTINHSLLSIEALKARGVSILGVAFIGEAIEHNEATIARVGAVRRLGRLPYLSPLDATTLRAAFAAHFDRADFA